MRCFLGLLQTVRMVQLSAMHEHIVNSDNQLLKDGTEARDRYNRTHRRSQNTTVLRTLHQVTTRCRA